MDYLFLFLIPVRALCYPLRGSAHPYPANLNAWPNYKLTTQGARLCFHVLPDILTIVYLCIVHDLPFWLVPISGLLSFGTICIGHSKYATNTILAYLGMTAILCLRVVSIYAPVAVYTHNWHYLLPVLAMMLVFPLCWLSYEPFMQRKLSLKIGKFCIPLIYTIPSSEPEELLIGGNIGLSSALEFICL